VHHQPTDGIGLPGVTVSVSRATTVRETFTDTAGCYSLPGLEPGEYAIEAKLAGFKPANRPRVLVRASETTRLDLSLCVGFLKEHVWVLPPTYEELVRSAQALVHVRIDATRLEPQCENDWLHTAQVLRVRKPHPGLSSPSIEFIQGASSDERSPYTLGTELIMAISLGRDGQPAHRYAGPFGVYFVKDRRIVWAHGWGPNRYDSMPLAQFVTALQAILREPRLQ
jgi:hypothetical protein